jgi:hypothetical protein
MLRATPQLSAQPCSSPGLLFEHSRDSPRDTRLPAGVCTLDPYIRAVPTSATFELSRVTSRGPPSGPSASTMASQLCISRDSVVSLASLHPCQQAAHFLVHTRPPDHCGLFVSADHAETQALCIASFVTNALLSPYALDWTQSWILRTSVLEWEYLSAEQKQQQTAMREAWLSGYSKPSESILQHWLWKFLKDRTCQFALSHLHQVFPNIPSNTPQCGTAAWTQILYTPSTIKTLLLNARTFGVLTACPRRLRPSQPCSTATPWPPCKSSSMQVARIMRMTAPTLPLPRS